MYPRKRGGGGYPRRGRGGRGGGGGHMGVHPHYGNGGHRGSNLENPKHYHSPSPHGIANQSQHHHHHYGHHSHHPHYGSRHSSGRSSPSSLSGQSSNNSRHRTPTRDAPPADSSAPPSGIFENPRLLHVTASLIGLPVRLWVQNGELFEGILRCVSPNMDVVLEAAHKVDDPDASTTTPTKHAIVDRMAFKLDDLACLRATGVDLDSTIKNDEDGDFRLVNGDVSGSGSNSRIPERQLEPWDGGVGSGDEELERRDNPIDELPISNGAAVNGWDANDMFRQNALKYGVRSSYDPSLKDYTTPLNKDDSEEFRQRLERAERLAKEIEDSPQHRARAEKENDDGCDGVSDDVGEEEGRWAAVARHPAPPSASPAAPSVKTSAPINASSKIPSSPMSAAGAATIATADKTPDSISAALTSVSTVAPGVPLPALSAPCVTTNPSSLNPSGAPTTTASKVSSTAPSQVQVAAKIDHHSVAVKPTPPDDPSLAATVAPASAMTPLPSRAEEEPPKPKRNSPERRHAGRTAKAEKASAESVAAQPAKSETEKPLFAGKEENKEARGPREKSAETSTDFESEAKRKFEAEKKELKTFNENFQLVQSILQKDLQPPTGVGSDGVRGAGDGSDGEVKERTKEESNVDPDADVDGDEETVGEDKNPGLNPNAKTFVFNPNAKEFVFSPTSPPSTTTTTTSSSAKSESNVTTTSATTTTTPYSSSSRNNLVSGGKKTPSPPRPPSSLPSPAPGLLPYYLHGGPQFPTIVPIQYLSSLAGGPAPPNAGVPTQGTNPTAVQLQLPHVGPRYAPKKAYAPAGGQPLHVPTMVPLAMAHAQQAQQAIVAQQIQQAQQIQAVAQAQAAVAVQAHRTMATEHPASAAATAPTGVGALHPQFHPVLVGPPSLQPPPAQYYQMVPTGPNSNGQPRMSSPGNHANGVTLQHFYVGANSSGTTTSTAENVTYSSTQVGPQTVYVTAQGQPTPLPGPISSQSGISQQYAGAIPQQQQLQQQHQGVSAIVLPQVMKQGSSPPETSHAFHAVQHQVPSVATYPQTGNPPSLPGTANIITGNAAAGGLPLPQTTVTPQQILHQPQQTLTSPVAGVVPHLVPIPHPGIPTQNPQLGAAAPQPIQQLPAGLPVSSASQAVLTAATHGGIHVAAPTQQSMQLIHGNVVSAPANAHYIAAVAAQQQQHHSAAAAATAVGSAHGVVHVPPPPPAYLQTPGGAPYPHPGQIAIAQGAAPSNSHLQAHVHPTFASQPQVPTAPQS